jgi:hypothetical protein
MRGAAALFAVLLAAVGWAGWRGPLHARPAECIAALLVAGAAWAGAHALLLPAQGGRALGPLIVAGAVALRVVAICGTFQTSDDHYRYAWEGGLVLDGKSPYAQPPDDPSLRAERERRPTVWAGLNHRDVSAAYPPVAQAAFACVVLATSLVTPAEAGQRAIDRGVERAEPGLRAFFALADLAVLVPLRLLLGRRGASPPAPGELVAWAWCPLVALEFAGAAHFDSLGILLLLAALAASARARGGLAGAALALGALVKLLPVALLPFVWRAARRRAPVVAGFLVPCLVALGGVWLLAGGLRGVESGISGYALRWEAASLVHRFLEGAFARVFAFDESLFDPRRLARAVELALWLGVGALAWRRRATPAAAAFALLAAFLVLSPTLHPWYVTWIVPFLALRRSPAFVFLAAVAPLLYAPLRGWVARGEWVEPAWLWPVVALPFLALLARELVRPRAAFRPGRSA